MKPSNLQKLRQYDQSIWLDFIERRILLDGTLANLVQKDGVSGLTSNPAMFEKAITETRDYQDDISALATHGASAEEIYEQLVTDDVRLAANILRPVFDETQGLDGYVSLEVSPLLAHDTRQTINEARRLWGILNSPNVMIKVPGTREGLPAFEQLIREGINVNVTLLFSVGRYMEVMSSYMHGLEQRLQDGNPIGHIASVASFFMSRIDTKADKILDEIIKSGVYPNAEIAQQIRGLAAIAIGGMAYKRYEEQFTSERWKNLSKNGARKQRLLWASTGTKDPAYSDIKYVEALIGKDTVNTMPMKTLEVYREHGKPIPRIHEATAMSIDILRKFAEIGIDLAKVDEELEAEGEMKFAQPYEKTLTMLAKTKSRVSN